MRATQICDKEAGGVALYIMQVSQNNPATAVLIGETVLAALIGAAVPPARYSEALDTLLANMKGMMEQQRLARAMPAGEA
jgi:hypothetical protein